MWASLFSRCGLRITEEMATASCKKQGEEARWWNRCCNRGQQWFSGWGNNKKRMDEKLKSYPMNKKLGLMFNKKKVAGGNRLEERNVVEIVIT